MIDERQKSMAIAALGAYMTKRRMRKTPERFAIYERILSIPDHFDIEELHATLENDDFHVSRATVYNTVNLLVESGLLVRHKFGERHSQFEHSFSHTRHHHLVCTKCGKVKEVVDTEIDTMLTRRNFGSFTPAFVELNIYGLCRSCAKKNKRIENANIKNQNKPK